jgi:hypothetical protein
MISAKRRATIKAYLEEFIQGLIEERRASSALSPHSLRPQRAAAPEGDCRPFHESILPEGILRISEFERSFSTKLGATFEEIARIIAPQRWVTVERNFRMNGIVSRAAVRAIEGICNRIGSQGAYAPWPKLIEEVLKKANDEGSLRERIADLYLVDAEGNAVCFEIKSPKPNKGQCVEITERLLLIHAMQREGPPRLRTFLAMAYNPYGEDKTDYKHSFALNYLDMENQVLVGKEFWDLVGGPGTYKQLLKIYREVGKEKGPDMLDKLALNY